MISNVDKSYFESIRLDPMYLFIGNQKLVRNASLGSYNQVIANFKIKHKTKIDKFNEWLCVRIGRSLPINDDIIETWERDLARTSKPSFYTRFFRFKRVTSTKIELYAVVDHNQLELICTSSTSMAREVAEYCLFWDEANQFCQEHGISSPAEIGIRMAKEELSMAMNSKLIPEINDVSVLSNSYNGNGYCLAYYDLAIGNPLAATPAWDSFLFQMVNDSCRRAFMAWVYSVFKGDNFGRQVLWLHGIGASGKSCIANTIYKRLELLTPSIVTSLERVDDMDKFSGSSYINKRFALGADTVDRKLLKNNLIKNLTGKDVISSREMGKGKIPAKVYAKILVTSNQRPFVDADKVEEVSRVILISLVPEKCKEAYANWHKNDSGNWEQMLFDEIDDFIAKSKSAYDEFIGEDGHRIRDYDGFQEEINQSMYFLKRDMPIWWKYCLTYTGNQKDTIQLADLYVDYERFLSSVMKLTPQIKFMIKRFGTTFLREASIEVESASNFNVLFIRGYRFASKQVSDRVKASTIVDKEIYKVVEE